MIVIGWFVCRARGHGGLVHGSMPIVDGGDMCMHTKRRCVMLREPDVLRHRAKVRKVAAESEAEQSIDRLGRMECRLNQVVKLLEEVQVDVAWNLEDTNYVWVQVDTMQSEAEEWRRRAQEALKRRRDRYGRRGADCGGRGGHCGGCGGIT